MNLIKPWDTIYKAAESLSRAYRSTTPGQADPSHLREVAESLHRAMGDDTDDHRVAAVAELVDSVAIAASQITADRKMYLSRVAELRRQVQAERAYMRTAVSELCGEINRLTNALGNAENLGGTA